MSMNMDNDVWGDASFAKIALQRMGDVPENFRIYAAGWLGEFPNCHGMQVTGAEFARMKRKTTHGTKIKGTERTVYVSKKDMRELDEREKRIKG